MPLVFIHGVNVRDDDTYERETTQRNQFFENVFFKLLGVKKPTILNPYWGDLAPKQSPGNIYLPKLSHKLRLASLKEKLKTQAIVDTGDVEQARILHLFKTQPVDEVLDVIVALAAESEEENLVEHAASLSKSAFQLINWSKQFKSIEDQRRWARGLTRDDELFERLEKDLGEDSSDPGVGKLKSLKKARLWLRKELKIAGKVMARPVAKTAKAVINGARAVHEKANKARTHIAAVTISNPTRQIFHRRLTTFIGDSFCYFGQRGTKDSPGAIPLRIAEAIAEADRARTADDNKLIVVAHSMGGNIICDLISYFQIDQDIDILLTVGSQFPLFVDLNMFFGLDTSQYPIKKPSKVKRWINVYDPNDFLGFAAEQMFDGIEDCEYASGRLGVATHADYFKFFSFYRCLATATTAPSKTETVLS